MNTSLTRNKSFLNLAGAQFLGHFNDNLFKMVVSLVAVEAASAKAGFYLSLASVLLVLPYLLFSGYAGHLADIASKRRVMNLCKVAEIVIMGAGFFMLAGFGSVEGLLFMLFLMAAHETFFSPSKYGSVPELVAAGDLARANGLLEASRYTAVIVGTAAGGILMELWAGERYRIGLVAIAIAFGGLLLTLRIKRLGAASTAQPWPTHPWSKLPQGLRRLGASRTLAVAVASLTFFESTAALVVLNSLLLAKLELGVGDGAASSLAGFAAVGCGAGALLCARISGPKIELGIVPLAGLGIAAVLAMLATSQSSYSALGGLLFALGLFGGLFFLPCLAWLQKAAGTDEKGLLLSTNNFLNMTGVLSASVMLWLLHDVAGLAPKAIFGVAAAVTVLYALTMLTICREIRARVLVFFRSQGSRQLPVLGLDRVPETGPLVLLSCDALAEKPALVDFCFDRPVAHVRAGASDSERECALISALKNNGLVCIDGEAGKLSAMAGLSKDARFTKTPFAVVRIADRATGKRDRGFRRPAARAISFQHLAAAN